MFLRGRGTDSAHVASVTRVPTAEDAGLRDVVPVNPGVGQINVLHASLLHRLTEIQPDYSHSQFTQHHIFPVPFKLTILNNRS